MLVLGTWLKEFKEYFGRFCVYILRNYHCNWVRIDVQNKTVRGAQTEVFL